MFIVLDRIQHFQRVGIEKLFQVSSLNYKVQEYINLVIILDTLCYEKGYANVGDALRVFRDKNDELVNWQQNILSVNQCINLCRSTNKCNWWNFDPDLKGCWLKTGKGNPKMKSPGGRSFEGMYTGHKDSTQQCQDRELFTPATYQQPNPSIEI